PRPCVRRADAVRLPQTRVRSRETSTRLRKGTSVEYLKLRPEQFGMDSFGDARCRTQNERSIIIKAKLKRQRGVGWTRKALGMLVANAPNACATVPRWLLTVRNFS